MRAVLRSVLALKVGNHPTAGGDIFKSNLPDAPSVENFPNPTNGSLSIVQVLPTDHRCFESDASRGER